MAIKIALTYGQRFPGTRLRYIQDTELQGRRRVWVQCDCGKITDMRLGDIRSGDNKSCGCHRSEQLSKISTTHGLTSRDATHWLYRRWLGMIQRCENPAAEYHRNYGGKGVSVCDEWRSDFSRFVAWVEVQNPPTDFEVHRKDSSKDYCPENCVCMATSEHRKLPKCQ